MGSAGKLESEQDVGTPAMTPQQRELVKAAESNPFLVYRRLQAGDASLLSFLGFEIASLVAAGVPGLAGLAIRSLLYRPFFASCSSYALGRGVSLRCPRQISLGKGCLIDDYVAIEAKGTEARITLGRGVVVGKHSIIAAKNAEIMLGNATNVSSFCRIASESKITIGESTLIAAYVYIGPGNHQQTDLSRPLIEQPMDIKGGVTIGKEVWIGTRATILDGVTIGDRAIVGAHSLVKEDVPEGAIVVGVPARVIGES
jgi:acetyltransferase-like isoleucine patch superfamily enzyme